MLSAVRLLLEKITAIKNAAKGIGTMAGLVEMTRPASTAIPFPPLNFK